MLGPSIIIASAVAGIALAHLSIAMFFNFIVNRHMSRRPVSRPVQNGLSSVIVSVRGCDPSLKKCLIGLLDQDYSNYQIHVVVDHRSDCAWSVVHEVKSEFDEHHRMTVHEMRKPLDTCGLKCSSLVQALEEFDPLTKHLVLIDADVVPHRSWLRDVTAPLVDPKVGVVSGNQWFEPGPDAGVGTVLRSLWNAGAIVPTAIFHNPWAGTFAMRMEDVRRAGLADVWRNSVVDDGPIRQAIKPLKLKIHFEPSLIMINREACTLEYVNRYVSRMLTWSKLYEKTFINTIIHATVTNGFFIASLIVLILSAFWMDGMSAIVIATGLVANIAMSLLAYTLIRAAVANVCKKRGVELGPSGLFSQLKTAVLAPVAQLVYGASCLTAIFTQKIMWRQITYEVKSKSQVKMLRYQPLEIEAEHAASASEVSI